MPFEELHFKKLHVQLVALNSGHANGRLRLGSRLLLVQQLSHLKRVVSFSDLPTIVLEYLIVHRVHVQIAWMHRSFGTEHDGGLNLKDWIIDLPGHDVRIFRRLREVLLHFGGGPIQVHVPRRVGRRIVFEVHVPFRAAVREHVNLALHLLILGVALVFEHLARFLIFALH